MVNWNYAGISDSPFDPLIKDWNIFGFLIERREELWKRRERKKKHRVEKREKTSTLDFLASIRRGDEIS